MARAAVPIEHRASARKPVKHHPPRVNPCCSPTVLRRQYWAESGPPDPDRAETAAMYTADFLRSFAGLGVGKLLLDEGPASAGELIHPEAYRPVLNVADHYGWPVLISAGSAPGWPFGDVAGVAAWLRSDPAAARLQADGRWGIVANAAFWTGTNPSAAADLVLAAVPAQADPDAVMQRVRALTT